MKRMLIELKKRQWVNQQMKTGICIEKKEQLYQNAIELSLCKQLPPPTKPIEEVLHYKQIPKGQGGPEAIPMMHCE